MCIINGGDAFSKSSQNIVFFEFFVFYEENGKIQMNKILLFFKELGRIFIIICSILTSETPLNCDGRGLHNINYRYRNKLHFIKI